MDMHVRVLDAVAELAADGAGEGGGEALEALVDDLGDDGVADEALAPGGRGGAAPDPVPVPAVVVLVDGVLLEGEARDDDGVLLEGGEARDDVVGGAADGDGARGGGRGEEEQRGGELLPRHTGHGLGGGAEGGRSVELQGRRLGA